MKKYPFVKQSEKKDCGVACLLMIIKYFDGNISKVELQELSKTNKNGTTAYHIIETLKYFDFKAKGIRINKFEEIQTPCIAHTIVNSYYHYVVIYEINFNKEYLIIGDPSDRLKKISFFEFEKIFNKIIITMSLTKKLPKYVNTESKISFCLSLISQYKKKLIKIILLSIFVTIFSIICSFYMQSLIDNIDLSQKYLLLIFIIFGHFYIFNLITEFLREKLLNIINKNIDYDLTIGTLIRIIKLLYRYYSSRSVGDIISRISDLENVRTMINRVALTLFVDTILVLTSFIILYFINQKLFLISLITFILYVLLILIFRPIINKKIQEALKSKGEATSYMIESISHFETVKGLNIEKNIIIKLKKTYEKLLTNIFKINSIYNTQTFFKNLLNDLCFILIIYLGVIEVINQNMTIGSLITFNTLIIYFLGPIKNIIDLDNNIINAKASIERILDLYYSEEKTGFINENIKGDININNLSFSYDDYYNTLDKISLNIKRGEKVLLLGESGCGKSTILKLIKKYYKTKRSELLIDNIDINDYTEEAINNNITYVSQNENLFTDTLYNNIILGRKISSVELNEIIKICNIDFIDDKLGLKMLIEENGFNLSGGQRQRVVLARSLINKFNILLLDETTNQVDYKLEKEIYEKLFKKFYDKTIIIVSHRNNNKELFDRIVKFERKKIMEINNAR